MKNIKVFLTWNMEIEDDENFEYINGDHIGEVMGQESINELFCGLDEYDDKMAKVVLVDDDGNIIKEKEIKLF